ncbi:MAG: maleylpyruvate isomerase family mycothiol-dependent enzyme [Frankiales bacterium]|jgi:uncharacterized protein (TIGR03083 family)|nr:maleylpyruvate isomerase family mycothiol-dependent enzyme [Frankiales bacterium]
MTVDHLAHLERDAEAFVAALRSTDLDAPVAACPEWALRDLAVHLGRVHRWAAGIVRTGERGAADAVAPADADLADWLADGAVDLLAALRLPERECWTFAGRGSSAFWVRRQALETAVHRVDAQRAGGAEEDPVPDDLAEDGIDEVLEVMLPRQVSLGRIAEPATGLTLVTGTTRQLGSVAPTAEVSGPAGAVLLLLWRRLPRTDPRLQVTGDAAALDSLLDVAVTP